MIDLGEFLELWKRRTNTGSDSNLARKVLISRASIALYRKGASFPSDDTMIVFATRGKLDKAECLLLLNYWRSKGEAQKQYYALLKQLYPESEFL